MSRKEILAYAITHAPRGQKGGPYEGLGRAGAQVPTLRETLRWRTGKPIPETLRHVRKVRPHARVIRIVRARPSEASAVEVLRSFIAWVDCDDGEEEAPLRPIEDAARRVLAASGPDPMPVVRTAMRFAEHCTPALEGSAWFGATREFIDAVDAYRKAGGK